MGNYAILFYFSHVVTIIIFANVIFWLKDIDSRFRDGEDSNFDDIPSLVEFRKKLAEGESAEKAKLQGFLQHATADLKEDAVGFALDLKVCPCFSVGLIIAAVALPFAPYYLYRRLRYRQYQFSFYYYAILFCLLE